MRQTDALTTVFHEQCANGDIIPSAPDVGPMWKAFHMAETAIVAGREVNAVLRRLRQSVEGLNSARAAL